MHYILLHGTGCTPDDHWFPWLRRALELQGHTVSIPGLPHASKPNWQEWSAFVLHQYRFDENTVIIGHSAGATVILSILEQLTTPIAKAILVAGFFVPLEKAQRAKLMLQEQYDRQKIRHNAREIVLINSDNDPRGCDATQARPVAEMLGATFVLAKGMGHMGTNTYHDPCVQLPLLLSFL